MNQFVSIVIIIEDHKLQSGATIGLSVGIVVSYLLGMGTAILISACYCNCIMKRQGLIAHSINYYIIMCIA